MKEESSIEQTPSMEKMKVLGDVLKQFNDLSSKEMIQTMTANSFKQLPLIVAGIYDKRVSGTVIQAFPVDEQVAIIDRIAKSTPLSDQAIESVIDEITEIIRSARRNSLFSSLGLQSAGEIMNYMTSDATEEILKQLKEADPEKAEKISPLLFTCENLVRIEPLGIQRILKETPHYDLIIALTNASETLKTVIFQNLSERAADMVKDDLDAMGPVQRIDVQTAQHKIAMLARRLEKEGKIVIPGSNQQFEVSEEPSDQGDANNATDLPVDENSATPKGDDIGTDDSDGELDQFYEELMAIGETDEQDQKDSKVANKKRAAPVYSEIFRLTVLTSLLGAAMWGSFFLHGHIWGTLLLMLITIFIFGVLINGSNFVLWKLPRVFRPVELIELLVIMTDVAKVARKNLEAVGDAIPHIENGFLASSLRLVVDRIDRNLISDLINSEKNIANQQEEQWVNQWKTISHLALVLGVLFSTYQIIKAVNFDLFSYQFYPLMLGGMLWIVLFFFSYRIKNLKENRAQQREMIVTGTLAIENRERAGFIEQKLFHYLSQDLMRAFISLKYSDESASSD